MGTLKNDELAERLARAAAALEELNALAFEDLARGDLLEVVRACQGLQARVRGAETRAVGALALHATVVPKNATATDLQLATRLTRGAVKTRLAESATLLTRLPETLEALAAGRITFEQARALLDAVSTLSEADARAVQERLLPRMPDQSLSDTKADLRRMVEGIDAQTADRRHKAARELRHVEYRALKDGMGMVALIAAAEDARAVIDALETRTGKHEKDDTRKPDARRLDLAIALLTATPHGAPGARRIELQVVASIDTLMNNSTKPGELVGHGPICAERVRELARDPDTWWRFLVTDSRGVLAAASTQTYRPTAAMRMLQELKYRSCIIPACPVPAGHCDIDHLKAHHKGGTTSLDNTAPECRDHHILKSDGYYGLEKTGDLIICRDPYGNIYTTPPVQYLI